MSEEKKKTAREIIEGYDGTACEDYGGVRYPYS